MAKAYVICGITGDGSDEAPFAPAIRGQPVNWAITIAPDHQVNPKKNWVLAAISGTESAIADVGAIGGVSLLPFGPAQLDDPWVSIGTANQRRQWSRAITSRTEVEVAMDDTRSLREVMLALGRSLDENFNPANLDVGE